ncbi:MAG: hypothetical protein AAF411_26475 [Myxococcota bacterium]
MRSFSLLLLALLALGCGDNQTVPPPRDAFVPGDAAVLTCVPNLDGVVEANELAPTLGIPVSLLTAPVGVERQVDVAGIVVDGRRRWDLGADFADDQLARIEASDLSARWFAGRFPDGEFISPLDLAGDLLGIFRHDDDALRLLGVASAEEAPAQGQTLYGYDTPIVVYRFPLRQGDEFIASSTITDGTLLGLPYAGRDTYEVRVVSTGVLTLPDLEFEQAHRVDTRITVAPAVGAAVVRRQVSWIFECFGEVARATSRSGEETVDFTTAAELRRLSLE